MVKGILSQWRCLAVLPLAAIAGAVAAHDGHGVPDSKRPLDGLGASAVFDANGTLWTVAKGGNHVVLHHTTDLGRTWSWGKAVNVVPEPIDAEGDARPKVAIGGAGEIYVSWTRPDADADSGHIRFARSLDGGHSFSAPLTVHADRQPASRRFPALAVNRDGSVFVAWVAKPIGMAARDKREGTRGARMHYTVSADRGASFSGEFSFSDQGCECCAIAMLPRRDGSVTAFWRQVFAPNLRDHAVASLGTDGRIDGFRRATLDNWAINACPEAGPSLAEDPSGRLHAVWFTLGPKRQGTFYGRLGDGGVEAIRGVGGKAATYADVAVLGNRIAVAWREFDGKRSRLRGLRSNDGGSTWREIEIAEVDGAADQPRLLTHQGAFHAFWNTRATRLALHSLP